MSNTKDTLYNNMNAYYMALNPKIRISMPVLPIVIALLCIPFADFYKAQYFWAVLYIMLACWMVVCISEPSGELEEKEAKFSLSFYKAFIKRKFQGFYPYLLLISFSGAALFVNAALSSGQTKLPITNINGIYLYQPTSVEALKTLGFDSVEYRERDTRSPVFIAKDISKPEVTYNIYYNPVEEMVTYIRVDFDFEGNDEVIDDIVEETIGIWDQKYQGGSLGEETRWHGNVELEIDTGISAWEDISIRLKDSSLQYVPSVSSHTKTARLAEMALYRP